MPELPEVEHIRRGLMEHISGKTIAQVSLPFPGLVKNVDPAVFMEKIRGAKVRALQRRGKYILVYLDQYLLEIHLRMTGIFLFYPGPVEAGPHPRAVFTFLGTETLHFQDVRKFGTFRLWEAGEMEGSPAFCLGLDPLEDDFSFSRFEEKLLVKPHTRLKSFLLDQRYIAGLGNIYVDEALHRARIHPARLLKTLSDSEKRALHASIVALLRESIQWGGTSFSDYRGLQGQRGVFQEHLKVYQKAQEPCFHCGHPLARIVHSGRGTSLCLRCQEPPLLSPGSIQS